MRFLVLDVKATHENMPDCKMRLHQDPQGNWYCADCGFRIMWKSVEVVEVPNETP